MRQKHDARPSPGPSAGFTLVEILIVVTILAILAAIVIPQFASATEEARVSSLKMNLWRFRNQLEVYREQHGAYPTLANFEDQLTLASNASGATAAEGTPGYPLGPYFTRISVNPFTSTSTVGNGVEGTSAWYYDQTTGEFLANDSVLSRTY